MARGADVAVIGTGVAAAVGEGCTRVGVLVAATRAGRGAGSERAGAAVAAAAGGRVGVGTTTVTSPRITASIVLSGVGWGRGVGNVWARA